MDERIVKIVAGCIGRKEWRSSAEAAALATVRRPTPAQRKAIMDYVREQYDSAGAGYSGRWQR